MRVALDPARRAPCDDRRSTWPLASAPSGHSPRSRMMLFQPTFLLFALVALGGCVGAGGRPPTVVLADVKYSEQRLRASDMTYLSAPYPEPAGTPMTILTIADNNLQGFIRVRKARHGRDEEFVPRVVNAGAYLVARKAAKHYRWGDAQSCLAQFTNEAYGYAPNSGDLTYQSAGMTADRKYSIFCSFAVGHPRLPTSAKAQIYKGQDLDRLASHPDVELIERAPSEEFRPSLTRIDDMIDRLTIHE